MQVKRIGLLLMVLVGIVGPYTVASGQESQTTVNNGNVVLEDIPPVPPEIVTDLNRYQNIRSAYLRAWSLDGKSLFITTRFGEVSQIHRVEQPAGARTQITFFQEPIGGVSRQPGGELLNFTMDAGGNEAAQIFLLNPDSGDYRMLSDGKSRHRYVLWTPDGTAVAYQSTRRNGRTNDVWLTNLADEKSEMLWEAPDNTAWIPADFTQDGRQLLIQQYVSVTDSRVHLLDRETGEQRLLVGSAEHPSRNLVEFANSFDADGQGIFLITDRASDFAQLAYLKLEDLSVEIITGDIPWDVEQFALSQDRTRGAFTINAGGISRLYLFDPANKTYAPVESIPQGIFNSIAFNPDNSQLAMTISSPTSPSDVYVLALDEKPLAHGELERWTFSEVGGLDTTQFIEPKLISYPTFDKVDGRQREIPAFYYRPRGEGPFPVVIVIHGGPESQFRPRFSGTFQLWADKLGIAVIAPNVRGSDGYGKEYLRLDNGKLREDSVKDIGALLDWIGTRPDLDKERVAVFGGSYGGYMVLASVVHYSERLKAAIDIVGISNFVTFLKNTKDYRRDLRRVEYGDERDPDMRAFLESISPTNHVDKMTTPLLVIQGQNDPRVPVTEAEQIVRRLREQGTKVWYMNALNEGHGYRKKENVDLYQQVVVMFLKKHLLGK